jgi:hypothetical protein
MNVDTMEFEPGFGRQILDLGGQGVGDPRLVPRHQRDQRTVA